MILKLFRERAKGLPMLFALLIAQVIVAQDQNTITGSVVDANGVPLPGASVVVQGTTIGASADFDGLFSLEVPTDATIVEVSYIGYITAAVPITDQPMNVVLQEDANQLDEVIVVGYGTQKKSDVVGSVTSVDLEEATAIPTTNVAEMLRGRAAGVQINLSDARPGGSSNILIRGKVSLEGNDPLIIVDGVPYDDINDVAADDISSIEVLKDASATAIYGARAANGVILITTKRGKEGKMVVNYHGYTTTQHLTKNFDIYSGAEFADLRREANRDRITGDFTADDVIFDELALESIQNQRYVNWEDLVLRDAVLQNHALSVSGGTESTKVYASVNYTLQDGLVPDSGFERGIFKLNVDQKINDRLSIQANINYQTSTQDIESVGAEVILISPLAVPFDENGDLIKRSEGESNFRINPLWNIRESVDEIKTNLTDINLTATYNITPSLSYKINTFSRKRNTDHGIYKSSLHSQGDAGRNGLAILSTTFYKEYLLENIINYTPKLNEANNLDFTFVQATNQRETIINRARRSGFPSDDLGFNGAATVLLPPVNDQDKPIPSREVSRRRMVSFLGRARYGLLDRYLFTLTARADASSVFSKDNKWGYFPAAAFAWKVHNESFLENSKSINELKFRASYGQTGNEGINPLESLGKADDIPYIFDGTTLGGFAPSAQLANPNLKWETTTTFNVGVDFGLFNNFLTGTVEYYKANTTDFLLNRFVPSITGYSNIRFNIGEVQNKGFEVMLNTNIIRKEDFQWSVGLTYSTNDNEVLELTGELDEEGKPVELPYDNNSKRLAVGQSINNLWVPQFDGIWQVSDDPATNFPDMKAVPGDVRVIDQNGDGKINAEDNIFIGTDPDWYGSVTTTLNYKGFDLFADFYILDGAIRNEVPGSAFSVEEGFKANNNGIKVPYYTLENPSTEHPRPKATTHSNIRAYTVKDASYTRLRTLTLGYSIPYKHISKLGLKTAKVYGTGTNLFTNTDFRSYSPEQSAGKFPEARSLTMGVKLGF